MGTLPSWGTLSLGAGVIDPKWRLNTCLLGAQKLGNGYITRAFSGIPMPSAEDIDQKWLLQPGVLRYPENG